MTFTLWWGFLFSGGHSHRICLGSVRTGIISKCSCCECLSSGLIFTGLSHRSCGLSGAELSTQARLCRELWLKADCGFCLSVCRPVQFIWSFLLQGLFWVVVPLSSLDFLLSAGFRWQTESISNRQGCGPQLRGPWHLWLKSASVGARGKDVES